MSDPLRVRDYLMTCCIVWQVLQCMDQSWVQDVAVALKDILTSKIG